MRTRMTAILSLSVLAVACLAGYPASAAAKDKPAPPAVVKIDLNSATADELDKLPGVGPATAKKIIASRPYKSVEDLKAAGLSPAEIAKIAPLVEVKATGHGGKAAGKPVEGKPAGVETPAKINLNTASADELDKLPGVGPATAKKIIAGRPYKTLEDLKAAGLSPSEIAKLAPLVDVKAAGRGGKVQGQAAAGEAAPAKINLNTASADELDKLPGVGPATAKKIIAGRPYKSVGDLKAAGLSPAEIAKIAPLVRVRAPISEAGPDSELDLNTATAEELEELPGIGEAYAKKIIAGRPYKSVAELSRSGIPAATLAKIAPMVTVEPTDAGGKAIAARTPPHPDMVWCNTDSKIFHRKGSRWYGKTQQGEWMTEANAIKAGYRAAK